MQRLGWGPRRCTPSFKVAGPALTLLLPEQGLYLVKPVPVKAKRLGVSDPSRYYEAFRRLIELTRAPVRPI